ncbi:MAG: tubulin-like doman-containing protein [Candidatus Fervidibacter sacchari]
MAQTEIRRALEDVAGQLQIAQTVQVAPTLVIGLGGSGTWTARRVKRLMQIRYGAIPMVRFLVIDTDQGAFVSEPELADVTDEEKVLLSITNPEQIFQQAKQGVGELEKLRDWLPDSLPVSILRNAEGAGGIRPVGRFALFASFDLVKQRLGTAINSLLAIRQEIETKLSAQEAQSIQVETNQPRIYIVGSLCGGTGSSLFLDIAVLVRHLFKSIAPNATPKIVGIFYLPSVFANEPYLRTSQDFFSIIQANAYAALKELEHFCDSYALQKQPFTFRYPNIGDISVSAPVYDEDFVLERGTADGRMLVSKEEVFEMAARSLLVDIGSPIGSKIRSANANTQTVLQMNSCPQTSKLRLIHSLGMTALSVPVVELLVHGALERIRSFINDHALGQVFTAEELGNEVDNFLKANKLDERGSRNDLLERLLSKNGEFLTYSLNRTREELEREAGGNEVQQAQYVANWIDSEMLRIRTELRSNAERLVYEHRVRVLQDAVSLIRNKVGEIVRQKGLRAAQQFIGELITVFTTIRNELLNEQQDYEQNRKSALENTIGNNVAFLRSLQGFVGLIKALGRADEMVMDEALRALREYGNAEILSVARQAALEIIGSDKPIDGQKSLLRQLEEWQRMLEQAIGKLNEIVSLCAENLSHRSQTTPTGTTYVLDQWVISPDEFSTYLNRIAVDPATYQDDLWQRLGSDLEQLLRNLTEKQSSELLSEMAVVVGERLRDALYQQVTIFKVIEEKRQRDEQKWRIETLMQTMLNTCKPFWRAPDTGVGGVSYQRFFAVTVPATQGEPNYQQIEQWLSRQLQPLGAQPELVHSGYPFAIEMVTRVYGARAFWLTSTLEMKHHYEQKRNSQTTVDLLHIDKRFLDLPDLYEGTT